MVAWSLNARLQKAVLTQDAAGIQRRRYLAKLHDVVLAGLCVSDREGAAVQQLPKKLSKQQGG
jgi:hypothetical protein